MFNNTAFDLDINSYTRLDQALGDLVDWYNVKFWTNGDTSYDSCDVSATELRMSSY